jgi:primosomal protein N' (replication factor Y) (superfamily II helicase)
MHYYEVAPNQIVRTNSPSFTYHSDTMLRPGQLVLVEIGKKKLPGVILRSTKQPTYDTKAVAEVIEPRPLPLSLVNLALWMSDYYATHLGIVLQTVLPRGLQKQRRSPKKLPEQIVDRHRTKIVLNIHQQNAVRTITNATPGSILLHGVTGSGKTAIYIEVAKQTIKDGKSVLILVPEIALTSQLVADFSGHFDDISLTHSRQTESERHITWQKILGSPRPQVVIGPRSALFMPINNLGLIVIDEAHEPSFKQEQSPRYSALRAASILANEHGAKLIIGSATPLIADYYLANHSGRPVITMSESARTDAVKPTVEVVDMTKPVHFTKHRFLSNKLLAQIEKASSHNKQSLIFHNRRGSASTTLCEHCGWMAMCPRCALPLTLHIDKHHLRCHVCDLIERVPTHCPVCKHTDIIHKGIGTKLIESELKKLFPDKTIARFDGDALAGDSVEQRYGDLYRGTIDIIVGTQVVAKGLDLPQLRVVGVIQADAGLSLPDYSASERTFQLLAQVVGRVGRSHHPTTVVIQSYQPNHPSVVDGLGQNYEHFYQSTLEERRRSKFPPFTFLLKLICVYKTEISAVKNARLLADTLRKKYPDVEILGPTPAFYERQNDTYRWQLVIKSPKRSLLVSITRELPPAHWQFELDPISLL